MSSSSGHSLSVRQYKLIHLLGLFKNWKWTLAKLARQFLFNKEIVEFIIQFEILAKKTKRKFKLKLRVLGIMMFTFAFDHVDNKKTTTF